MSITWHLWRDPNKSWLVIFAPLPHGITLFPFKSRFYGSPAPPRSGMRPGLLGDLKSKKIWKMVFKSFDILPTASKMAPRCLQDLQRCHPEPLRCRKGHPRAAKMPPRCLKTASLASKSLQFDRFRPSKLALLFFRNLKFCCEHGSKSVELLPKPPSWLPRVSHLTASGLQDPRFSLRIQSFLWPSQKIRLSCL